MVGWDSWSQHEGWWQQGGKTNEAWSHSSARPVESFSQGEEVEGTVSNVTDFGVFVDFGCVRDGLLPHGAWSSNLQPGDWLEGLTVSRVDCDRNRISLRHPAAGPGDRGRGRGRGAVAEGRGGGRRGRGGRGGRGAGAEGPAAAGGEDLWATWKPGGAWEADAWWLQNGWEAGGEEDHTESWNGWEAAGEEDHTESWSAETWWESDSKADASRSEASASRARAAPQAQQGRAKDKAGSAAEGTRQRPGEARPPGAAPAPRKRSELTAAVFRAFDRDGDGRLCSAELREFAGHTGFDGGDEAWAAEYRLLCEESEPCCDPALGLDETTFFNMVNDKSDDGCFCSDEELTDMLAKASPPAATAAPSGGRAEGSAGAAEVREAATEARAAPAGPAHRTRDELIRAAFSALDTDGDGRLKAAELRVFAESTGFDGTDEEWKEEYALLCEESAMRCDPVAGVDEASFVSMVNDSSDAGCYCNDEELEALLAKASPPAAPPSASAPRARTRPELIAAVFGHFDADGDGRLGAPELRAFASHTGFDGSDEDWEEEYRLLCTDSKPPCSPRRGMDRPTFLSLVNDESDQGCFCSDEELRAMLPEAEAGAKGPPPPFPAKAAPPPRAPAPPPPRAPAGGGEEAEAWPGGVDPWEAQRRGGGKDGGKGGGKARGAGKGAEARPAEPADSGRGHDPLSANIDPWSTPGAKRATEKLRQATAAAEAESQQTWGAWTEAGRPGAEAAGKPAMDAQKLLDASRAMIAARKAKQEEEEAVKREQERIEQELSRRRADCEAETGPSDASASSSAANAAELARGPKMVSMPAALASVGAVIAKIAFGDAGAGRELVSAVLCAPCVAHALAVASNALRSLLQGRVEEARLLLRVEELHFSPVQGDAALLGALCELARSLGSQGAPFLVRALLAALVKLDDKQAATRAAAARATEEIVAANDVFAFEALLPFFKAGMDAKRSPAMKLHVLRLLARCHAGRDGQRALAQRLPQLLPLAAVLLLDTSLEVRAEADSAVEQLLNLCGNSDLDPHLDEVLGCFKGCKDVSSFVQDLAEVVFVQQVEAPALAAVMPVLTKGLKSRSMRTQRQTCIIAANMCKLVSAVTDVQPFAPQLLPSLKRISEEASDPDVRAVAGRAHSSLLQVSDADVAGGVRFDLTTELTMAASAAEASADGCDSPGPCPEPVRKVVLDYVAMLSSGLGLSRVREEGEWRRRVAPLLEPLMGSGCVAELLGKLRGIAGRLAASRTSQATECTEAKELQGELDSDLDVLCDCTLTLACGAATVLSGARLRLARGHVYGLVGGNDSGKSTLLRALHERRVVGFPPAGHLVTALVEHGVGERKPECDRTPLEYLLADPAVQAMRLPDSEVTAALRRMGFDSGARLKKPIKTLSGGWRMKLGIVRAMLQEPDVLLLDEPTGHLDAAHIGWLVEYINDLRTDKLRLVTALIVSHDSPFLDRVCTDVIHLAEARLRTFRGNLTQFLEQTPDAQLGSGVEKEQPLSAFALPEPGALEGVKSKGKRFLYLQDVFFTYPGASAPAVRRGSVECSLRSRVAIVGPNGAGKSTLAGLVVGELAPDLGQAWRHPNLRVAYVAQHAFHHLEQHMDLTATQYILWRFNGNEDREANDLRATEVECEEPKTYRANGDRLELCDPDDEGALQLEVVLNRRQRGRLGYEYEVKWCGESSTAWLSGTQLAAMGHLSLARREDERQAAQHSLSSRPLTTPSVEAHLAGFGLDAEQASHRRLSALSNGQRARVVLAAATWLAPHLLVLDEPTNYLDRPGLSALVAGLKGFGGGVLAISHTTAFLDEVCTEKWVMEQGALRREGAPPEGAGEEPEASAAAAAASAAAAAARAAKEKKRLKRLKERRRKDGEQVSDDEEEWWEELQRKAGGSR